MINKALGPRADADRDESFDESLEEIDLDDAELYELTFAELDERLDTLQMEIAYLTRSVRVLSGFISIGLGLLILHTGTQLQQQWHQLLTWVQALAK